MCQKAFGGFYAPLVSTRGAKLVWTRGEPKRYASSNHVLRGFCPECGTPLTYEAADVVDVATGAFDDPAAVPPVIQFGVEAKLPFCDAIPNLPERVTLDDLEESPFLSSLVSNQHPDHDTETWPL